MAAKRKMPDDLALRIQAEYNAGACGQCRGFGHGCGSSGDVTVRSLAEKHGVSKSAVHRVLSQEIA